MLSGKWLVNIKVLYAFILWRVHVPCIPPEICGSVCASVLRLSFCRAVRLLLTFRNILCLLIQTGILAYVNLSFEKEMSGQYLIFFLLRINPMRRNKNSNDSTNRYCLCSQSLKCSCFFVCHSAAQDDMFPRCD